MAAPLSGIGQQQVPLSQPFQPGGNDQTREVRQRDQEPREFEVQSRGAATAQSQDTNTKTESFQKSDSSVLVGSNSNAEKDNGQRGSVVNIVV